MSGSTATLWRQLHEREAPLSLVLYESPAALEDVLETVRLVAPEDMRFVRTHDVEDAFIKPDVPLLLTPDQEAAAVATLDGRREALLARTATAVLFLLKDGTGERALRRAFGLASWLQSREWDPEPAPLDVERERARFTEIAGRPPGTWLDAWRRGEIPDTLENSFLYQRALLLEGKARPSQKHWYGQVHLTEKPEGEGLCGHALLHCHIGSSPEEATEKNDATQELTRRPSSGGAGKHPPFSPRVPLPWLQPWEALEWLLATVDPELEPAPH